ncbi:MAG: ABC transporter permease [Acidimicrobiia bacterium]|nr:ABC transporter permease [Acidimicrobiia bacterium]
MSSSKAWLIMRKELRMGPRSPLFLYALILPIVMTFVIVGVFGSLFAPSPRLGIVDEGNSSIVASAQNLEGIDVTTMSSVEALKTMVEANDLDAGLVLTQDFDAKVRNGTQPPLKIYVGGESLASNRIILQVTTLDLVREVSGEPAPIEVDVVTIGDAEALPMASRMVPLLMIYAVAISAAFVPAASIVQEKEKGTINSVLVTPTTVNEFLAGKAGLGIVLGMATGIITLILNNAFGNHPLTLTIVLLVAAVMMAEIGLILGIFAKDSNMLFALMKSGGILLFYPVVFYIWPSLPQWIAKIAPTYWFLQPIFEVGVKDASFGDIWIQLVIALAWIAVLLPAVFAMAKRLEQKVAIEA